VLSTRIISFIFYHKKQVQPICRIRNVMLSEDGEKKNQNAKTWSSIYHSSSHNLQVWESTLTLLKFSICIFVATKF